MKTYNEYNVQHIGIYLHNDRDVYDYVLKAVETAKLWDGKPDVKLLSVHPFINVAVHKAVQLCTRDGIRPTANDGREAALRLAKYIIEEMI